MKGTFTIPLAASTLATALASGQISLVSQARNVWAQTYDQSITSISAPDFGPFNQTATSTSQYGESWVTASQNSALGASGMSIVGATRGWRSSGYVPYPSSGLTFDVTFDVTRTCVYSLVSTWGYGRWTFTGPGVSEASFGTCCGKSIGGLLEPGRYAIHVDSMLEHMAGTIISTDVSVDFRVTVCGADVDDDGIFPGGHPDGGIDANDLLFFLAAFEAGDTAADLDNGTMSGTPDGGVDIGDLLYFLASFEAGC